MYGTLVAHLTDKKFNFLEIGLGCDHNSLSEGKSIGVWREYLPHAIFSLLEFNQKCAEPFRSKVDNLFIGDQSDLDLLKVLGSKGRTISADSRRWWPLKKATSKLVDWFMAIFKFKWWHLCH